MRRLLLHVAALPLLTGSPALADQPYYVPIPDPGQLPRAKTVSKPPVATEPEFIDAEGTRWTQKDYDLGFRPVLEGYKRAGGGFVRNWTGSAGQLRVPAGYFLYGGGLARAIPGVTTAGDPTPPGSNPPGSNPPGGNPPGGNPPGGNPPVVPVPVPGPLGLGALAAAFALSRRLRRRGRPSPSPRP
jgi:hypothetical protein